MKHTWVVCLLASTAMAQGTDPLAGLPSDCIAAARARPDFKPPANLSGPLPAPDFLDAAIGCAAPAPSLARMELPRSEWQEGQSKRYSDLLATAKFPWLVLPAQTQSYGFDRVERALIGMEIAEAFAGEGAAPHPFLVAGALGELKRRYEPGASDLLAQSIGSNRLVETYVGHDGAYRMTLTVRLKECAANRCRLLEQHDWRALPFSDEKPPFRVVHELQAELRQRLLGLNKVAPAPPAAKPIAFSMHRSAAAIAGKPFEGDRVALAGLLAALAPADGALGREKLFEIALQSALREASTPGRKLLAAYAALHLYRRPYALALLEGEQDAAATTLRSLLDGNLNEARETLPKVAQPLPRLLLALAVHDLRTIYGRKGEFDAGGIGALFGDHAPEWRMLIDRRASDIDGWADTSTRAVKLLLDTIRPISGLDLRSMVKGAQVVDRPIGDEELEVANIRHLRQAFAGLRIAECCGPRVAANASWQMFWLLEGSTEANIMKSARRELYLRGLPKVAIRQSEMYAPFYGGHPLFEMMRFNIATELVTEGTPAEIAAFSERADAAERVVVYWSQGQSEAAQGTVGRLWSTRLYREAYSLDFPQRHFWRAQSRKPGDERSACANLLYSTHDPSTAVECLATTPEAQKPALRAHIATRFHGSPRAAGIEMPPASGDADRVVQLRAAIDSDPAHWPNYQQLGVLLLQGGLYEEAQQMYLGWPDFKTAEPGSALGSSNAAYESGSELYWRGRPELARPLYEIAAKLRTGSSASMTSELRLALLDGDFEAAVQGSLERGSRYPNAYAFRDYFSLLYVLGRARDAEAGFSQVASDFDNPQMWSAQLVGHRMRGMTVNQLKAWILEPGVRDAHRFGRRFAGTYLLWWATTDRKLSPDVVELVGQVERDAVRTIDTDGVTLRRPNTQGDGNERLAASTFRKGQSPRLAPETRVKSELVLFADALASVHAADYPSAVTKFVALADRYPIEHGEMQASLSYFALAAAKTGDKLGLERYIESLPETQGFPAADRTFDMWLARAYFAVVRREFAKADEALRRAFNSRPHTDVRPVFSEYQFAEACEFALRESGDQRFSRRMLDWAKRHQQIQPTQAWAYAIEAQYSKIPADAERALAMALYLDPASPRLAKIDAARRAGARAWLQKHNPFLVRPEPMRQRTAGGG